MRRFKQKIRGNKHSIAYGFSPLVESLDWEFGEETVYIGRFCRVSHNAPGICIRLKYYDPRKQAYRLQAKKGYAIQYFFLKLDEERGQEVEEFVRKYPK
ncbi:MAG TPA: hypothetical protein VJ485_04565 [archaeon]|nr:hypothetical protein [archaeon]